MPAVQDPNPLSSTAARIGPTTDSVPVTVLPLSTRSTDSDGGTHHPSTVASRAKISVVVQPAGSIDGSSRIDASAGVMGAAKPPPQSI